MLHYCNALVSPVHRVVVSLALLFGAFEIDRLANLVSVLSRYRTKDKVDQLFQIVSFTLSDGVSRTLIVWFK